MRTIAVVTVARSDYGIYLPILKKIQADDSLSLHLIVAGAHLTQRFGDTLKEFEADGLPIGSRVEMLLASDSPRAISASMGLGAIGFSEVYDRIRPDLLLVLGDRFEMHAAASRAVSCGPEWRSACPSPIFTGASSPWVPSTMPFATQSPNSATSILPAPSKTPGASSRWERSHGGSRFPGPPAWTTLGR